MALPGGQGHRRVRGRGTAGDRAQRLPVPDGTGRHHSVARRHPRSGLWLPTAVPASVQLTVHRTKEASRHAHRPRGDHGAPHRPLRDADRDPHRRPRPQHDRLPRPARRDLERARKAHRLRRAPRARRIPPHAVPGPRERPDRQCADGQARPCRPCRRPGVPGLRAVPADDVPLHRARPSGACCVPSADRSPPRGIRAGGRRTTGGRGGTVPPRPPGSAVSVRTAPPPE